jgi:predicted alternative tryptophan synthase beta-subunit
MVKISYEQKPFRKAVMETFGAGITPSPSMTTEVGKKSWKKRLIPMAAWDAPSQKRLKLP